MLYDIDKTYLENIEQGPQFSGPLPERERPPRESWVDFLGKKVASPLGVPAGPLLSEKWTTLAARLGFDIVTYKTIRSLEYAGHPLPNILYIDAKDMGEDEGVVHTLKQQPHSLKDLAITNSFGMPSQDRDFLFQDIARARQALGEGQVLVVSIVGTPGQEKDFIEDFVETAFLAKQAGAEIIEANFSCPNVSTGEGSVYQDSKQVERLSLALKKVLGPIPLIIKVGVFSDFEGLKQVLIAAERSGVQAVSGINTISREVLNEEGRSPFDSARVRSGICGAPIRKKALEFITRARAVIQQENLDLQLIGVGGVITPEHIDDFLVKGADFVQVATGMMWNPYLAQEYHQRGRLN